MLNVTDLRNGTVFKENGDPYLVLKFELIKLARQGAYIKVKAKNLLSGAIIERSWHSNLAVEEADVYRRNSQYLYKDGKSFVFMDTKTYDQETISEDLLGESSKFLKEGQKVQVLFYEGRPIAVDLPPSAVFEVTYTEPGYKGNTVSNVYKPATIETGALVRVPMFITKGEKIKVDTRTGEYLERA
ncbi:elongation factor P [candidate division WWE3 bacterium]|nr:elongation factor P [candidate division WWE3 bacterium]